MEKQPHIQLDSSLKIKKAIIVGDPKRVSSVLEFLDHAKEITFNREYRSAFGTYQGARILVVSTGIGAPSATIGIEELISIGVEEIIRVGSCGAMQSDFKLGEIMVVSGVVRDDGTTKNYVPESFPAIPDSELLCAACTQHDIAVHIGIGRSHDSFYNDNNADIEAFWSNHHVLGADMESGALYVLGQLRGIKTLSILNNVVLYQDALNEGVNQLVSGDDLVIQGEKKSIQLALNILTRRENK
ncbi:nucleoside phosphorylase [Vagococcus silagei]|uniref:Uridine phosphorylase n=1 Tax=Vagococcus silagei TaxID=2508885 RepID=A0A4S3B591_9ENTE|nr:nucleoside phosphorylase [Vagococcus silagei]THB62271.1 nucleoside phosphorylase [Vagococcus silagei]